MSLLSFGLALVAVSVFLMVATPIAIESSGIEPGLILAENSPPLNLSSLRFSNSEGIAYWLPSLIISLMPSLFFVGVALSGAGAVIRLMRRETWVSVKSWELETKVD